MNSSSFLDAADRRNVFKTEKMPFTVGIVQVRDYSVLTGTPLEPKHCWFWDKGWVCASPFDAPVARGIRDRDLASRYTFPEKVAIWLGLPDES
jgi:hypothetical protein